MRSGQEKQREGVIPNTSLARCSNTATYLFSPLHPPEIDVRDTICSLCLLCHKDAPWLAKESLRSQSFGITSHPVCSKARGFAVMPLC